MIWVTAVIIDIRDFNKCTWIILRPPHPVVHGKTVFHKASPGAKKVEDHCNKINIKIYKERKQLNIRKTTELKHGRGAEVIFPRRTYRWTVGMKDASITDLWEAARQSHNEVSPHIRQNSYHQKRQQIANAVNNLQRRTPCVLQWECKLEQPLWKTVDMPQKLK